MRANNKILVVVEPDNNPNAVVDRAGWLARLMDFEIELLLCDPSISVLGDGFFVSNEAKEIGQKIRTAQQEMIDELAENARHEGVKITTGVLEERPIGDAVLSRALDIEPAFVMKGTQYHSIAERAIMVDTDWQLIRTCPYPLWLVKPGEFKDSPVVIAAVDPTHEHDKPAALDQAIVAAARSVAEPAGGKVHLLHTYERLIGIGSAASKTFKPIKLPIEQLAERMKKEHCDALDAFAETNDFDKKFVHMLPGRTHDILPAFVRDKNGDLVVMGALARWGLKRMVIGSTAEKVLDHLPCDVLIVRSE